MRARAHENPGGLQRAPGEGRKEEGRKIFITTQSPQQEWSRLVSRFRWLRETLVSCGAGLATPLGRAAASSGADAALRARDWGEFLKSVSYLASDGGAVASRRRRGGGGGGGGGGLFSPFLSVLAPPSPPPPPPLLLLFMPLTRQTPCCCSTSRACRRSHSRWTWRRGCGPWR